MIDGLAARWIQNSVEIKEIELIDQSSAGDEPSLILTVVLVVGPPDPNALSYLVPRAVFERDHPVHVGALSEDQDITEGMLEILEVMGSEDIVVFICQNDGVLEQAVTTLEPVEANG